jgi:branched-chain amino acid transport system ATP-binding protein
VLDIVDLKVGYGHIEALRGVSMRASGGEIVAVVGANGAGKSTLLKAIAGFVGARGGQLLLDGAPLRGSAETRARSGIALVPEGRQVWSELTVDDHLRLGLRSQRVRRRARDERLDEVFTLFPRLAERRKQKAGTLSGGEQQMLVIGRALIAHPRVLLLDEPSLGLAPVAIEPIAATLDAARSEDRVVILAEQNAEFAFSCADRGYVLEVGENRIDGSVLELARNPELVEAYLGVELDLSPTA